MKPSKGQLAVAGASVALGLAALGLLVGLLLWAASDASNSSRIFVVGVVATLVSPVAFSLFPFAWRMVRPPSASVLRFEANAKQRLAEGLEDLKLAESKIDEANATKAQIEVYIRRRSRKLDIQARLDHWDSRAAAIWKEHHDLEAELSSIELEFRDQLSPDALQFLNSIVEPEPSTVRRVLEIVVPLTPWPLHSAVAQTLWAVTYFEDRAATQESTRSAEEQAGDAETDDD